MKALRLAKRETKNDKNVAWKKCSMDKITSVYEMESFNSYDAF